VKQRSALLQRPRAGWNCGAAAEFQGPDRRDSGNAYDHPTAGIEIPLHGDRADAAACLAEDRRPAAAAFVLQKRSPIATALIASPPLDGS
jgi:hypothetical protein